MLIQNPPVEIAENLVMLGTSAYPLYLFRHGGEAVLFEGGAGALGQLVARQIAELGIDGESLKQLVIPHAHPDHVMAVQSLRESFPAVTVVAGETAAKVLSNPKAVAFFCKMDQALADSLLKLGTIGDAYHVLPPPKMTIAVDRTIAAGETLPVGEARFEAITASGHSDCGLSFHEPARGILVVSDATPYYIAAHGFWWPNYFTGYQAYLDTMRSLAALKPEIACLGHSAAVKGTGDVAAFFSGAIAATEAYHRQIVERVQAGATVRTVAEALGSEVFEKVKVLSLDFFQKNCGLLVKQSLLHEGIVVEDQK